VGEFLVIIASFRASFWYSALAAVTLMLGAAETVVGVTDTFKPCPDRRGLYRPNPMRGARPGLGAMQPPLKIAAAR